MKSFYILFSYISCILAILLLIFKLVLFCFNKSFCILQIISKQVGLIMRESTPHMLTYCFMWSVHLIFLMQVILWFSLKKCGLFIQKIIRAQRERNHMAEYPFTHTLIQQTKAWEGRLVMNHYTNFSDEVIQR